MLEGMTNRRRGSSTPSWWRTRLRYRTQRFWVLPIGLLACSVALSWLMPYVDGHLTWRHPGDHLPVLSHVNDSVMAGLLTAISTAMITLAGLVFNAITLAMQFGAGNLSVRIVPTLRQDRVLRWATGVFVSTFLYTLLIAIRFALHQGAQRPIGSTLMALLMTAACAVMFIALVARVSSLLNPTSLLHRVTMQGVRAINHSYPNSVPEPEQRQGHAAEQAGQRPSSSAEPDDEPGDGSGDEQHGVQDEDKPAQRPGTPIRLHTTLQNGRVLLAVNERRLLKLATKWQVELELVPATGDFAGRGTVLFLVHGDASRVSTRQLLHCLLFGDANTPSTDPASALRGLVDIALKGLSPAVNDPSKASQAMDHIEQLLLTLVERDLVGPFDVTITAGHLTRPNRDWADYVSLATDEIRHYARDSLQVQRRLRALLLTVGEQCTEERREVLHRRLRELHQEQDALWPNRLDRELAGIADAQGLGIGRRPTV